MIIIRRSCKLEDRSEDGSRLLWEEERGFIKKLGGGRRHGSHFPRLRRRRTALIFHHSHQYIRLFFLSSLLCWCSFLCLKKITPPVLAQ